METHSAVIELTGAEAVERAIGLAGRGRSLVGVTGCPGAGKSTLSSIVAVVESSAVVPMDGFHLLNEELDRLRRRDRKGAPDTFDVAGYVALLRRVRGQSSDEVVTAPRYDRAAGSPVVDAIAIEPAVRLVITEGNYLLVDQPPWDAVRPLLDEVWFVDIDDAVRIPRLINRHIEFGKSPEAAEEWVMRSDEANAALVMESRRRADVIVRFG
jgi:pantothenate kinase